MTDLVALKQSGPFGVQRMSDREIPERSELKSALRSTGLSSRQTDALLREGYKALIGETLAENAELREKLEELANTLK